MGVGVKQKTDSVYVEVIDELYNPLPLEVNHLGMHCHLLSLTQSGVPLGNLWGALVVCLTKKDADHFAYECAKEG